MKLDQRLVFCKLGGSVITDKTRSETVRRGVLDRLASEVAAALNHQPDLALLLGHGSGSFGHVAARRYGTRDAVCRHLEWRVFARVAAVASRLGLIVADAFLEAGIPVWPELSWGTTLLTRNLQWVIR